MIYIASETAYVPFAVNSSTGAAANADSLPTAVLVRNGAVDGAVTVTVTNLSTGAYIASFAVPSDYVAGDELVVLVSATIATVPAKNFVGHGKVDVLATTVNTQATTAATQATAANGKLTSAFTNMVTRWNTMVEQIGSSGLYRYLSGALSQAPTGSGGSTRLVATPLRAGRVEPVRYTRGASGPDLRDWVMDGTGGRIDVTGYTVTARMIQLGTEALIFEDATATLGHAPEEGQVELAWPEGALDYVGSYKLIWTLEGSGGPITWATPVVVE